MERSTVYILLKKTALDDLMTTSKDKYNELFGHLFEQGWGSLKEYVGMIGEEKEHLYLITLDDMKWDRYYSDVEAVYEYFELLDYWELLQIRDDGKIVREADENTENSYEYLLEYNSNVNLCNLEPVTSNVTPNDLPELVGQIVDLCEDYLDENKIVLTNNPEREEAIAEGEDAEGLAQIYGSDYDLFTEDLKPQIELMIRCNTKLASIEADNLATDVITTLWGILVRNKAEVEVESLTHSLDDFKSLRAKIIKTFENWGLIGDNTGNYLLITVFNRAFSYHKFKHYDDAKRMMEHQYKEVLSQEGIEENEEDLCGIKNNGAWVNGNDDDYDWELIKVA